MACCCDTSSPHRFYCAEFAARDRVVFYDGCTLRGSGDPHGRMTNHEAEKDADHNHATAQAVVRGDDGRRDTSADEAKVSHERAGLASPPPLLCSFRFHSVTCTRRPHHYSFGRARAVCISPQATFYPHDFPRAVLVPGGAVYYVSAEDARGGRAEPCVFPPHSDVETCVCMCVCGAATAALTLHTSPCFVVVLCFLFVAVVGGGGGWVFVCV